MMLLHASLTAVLTSLSSSGSNPRTSPAAVDMLRTRRAASGRLVSSRRTRGASISPLIMLARSGFVVCALTGLPTAAERNAPGSNVLAIDRSGGYGVVVEPHHRSPQQTRYVHLRAADPLADLALGELLDEPQAQHLALDVAERSPAGHERLAILGQLVPAVLAPERVAERAAVLVLVGDRRIERRREIVVRRVECLDHLLHRAFEQLAQLVDGR